MIFNMRKAPISPASPVTVRVTVSREHIKEGRRLVQEHHSRSSNCPITLALCSALAHDQTIAAHCCGEICTTYGCIIHRMGGRRDGFCPAGKGESCHEVQGGCYTRCEL